MTKDFEYPEEIKMKKMSWCLERNRFKDERYQAHIKNFARAIQSANEALETFVKMVSKASKAIELMNIEIEIAKQTIMGEK